MIALNATLVCDTCEKTVDVTLRPVTADGSATELIETLTTYAAKSRLAAEIRESASEPRALEGFDANGSPVR